jgi:hypothetical protein
VATGDGAEAFFAASVEDLEVADVAGARAVVVGRTFEMREVRGAVLLAAGSAAAREVVVVGRLGAAVVDDTVGLLSAVVVFPGERVLVEEVNVDFRAATLLAGFLFSSPEVMDERSGSWSDAVDLDAPRAVFLAVVPGAGRVGGLLRLDPSTLLRLVVVVEEGLDRVEDLAAVVEVVAGRFAAAAVVELVNGRRGAAVAVLEDATGEDIFFLGVVDAAFAAG